MAITSCSRWAVAVVDDDAAVCDSMRCLLEAYDLDVQTYQRGADFLKNQPEIACLITDYDLPDIDGLELISELRKRGSQVPIIMSTAATDPWIKRCVAEAGIKFVLEKPYSYEALLGAIREELFGVGCGQWRSMTVPTSHSRSRRISTTTSSTSRWMACPWVRS